VNVPNKLTIARFILTGVFLMAFFSPFRFGDTIALVIFIAASLTDYYDGKIARRDNLITNFGILMDPLADKILICSAFIAFVGRSDPSWVSGAEPWRGLMPAWMAVVIVARELAITGLRLLAANKQLVLAAERYGKHKTVSQIVATIAVLVLVSYPEWGPWGKTVFGWWVPPFRWVALYISVALTGISGALYLWRNRELYLSDLNSR
jgi:CDP-diacylglycerol--glycerol-3-phosphate 3-phosphatidyltransferase